MFSLSSVIGNSGGLSNLIDKTTKKYRPVYLFPSVIVSMKDKNTAVIDFVSQLFCVTEPNRVQKTLTILKRTLTLIENSSAAQNHCNLPEDRDMNTVAKSTPGPILPVLATDESYSPMDSLRIVYYCQAQPSSNSSWAELALLSLYPPAGRPSTRNSIFWLS